MLDEQNAPLNSDLRRELDTMQEDLRRYVKTRVRKSQKRTDRRINRLEDRTDRPRASAWTASTPSAA